MTVRRGLSQVQWIAIVATGLLIGVVIIWGVYSGIVDDVIGTIEVLFDEGSNSPERVEDPFNNTAHRGEGDAIRSIDRPITDVAAPPGVT